MSRKAERGLLGNIGASDVVVLMNAAGLTFVEQTSGGGAIFVTVFGSQVKGEYVFVYSSHIELLGMPRPSQYYGTCTILLG
jgi:hypothetical protein